MKITSMKPWKYVSKEDGVYVVEGRRTRPLEVMRIPVQPYCEGLDLAYSILMDYFLHFNKSIIEAHQLAAPLYDEFKRHVLDQAPENFEIGDDRIDMFLAYQPEHRIGMAS